MGQYYIHVNVDKKQAYSPSDFGSGVKLTEHTWVGNRAIQVLDTLLRGEWRGDRVVVAGDYFEVEENESLGFKLVDVALYDVDWQSPEVEVAEANSKTVEKWEKQQQTGFYLNYDGKEAIDLSKLPESEKWGNRSWIMSPLALMIACGNGRGGGDFKTDNPGYDCVGRWAGDHVGIEDKLPKGFDIIKPDFIENT